MAACAVREHDATTPVFISESPKIRQERESTLPVVTPTAGPVICAVSMTRWIEQGATDEC
jgi:hypothetical protein